jgi:hypothetical protein
MPGTPDPTTPREHSRRTGATGVLVTVLSLVFVVVVAVLAGGSSGDATRLSVPELAGDTLLDIVFAVAVVYSLVVVVLLVVALFGERGGPGSSPAPKWASMILGMALMGALLWFAFQGRSDTSFEIAPAEMELTPVETMEPSSSPPVADPPPGWVWLVAIGLVAAAAATVAWTVRGARRPPPGVADPDEALRRDQRSMADLLDDAIDDLRHHPDPRAAVIAAFARLEAGLAVVGIPREVADTPLGYLQRVLAHVEVSAPAVERLTESYEEAKYSLHEVTRSTQLGAADALVEVRDELRVLGRRDLRTVGS